MWEIYALENACSAVYGPDKLLHVTQNIQTQMKSTVSGHSEYHFRNYATQKQTIATVLGMKLGGGGGGGVRMELCLF